MKPKIGLVGLTAGLYQQKVPEKVKEFGSFSCKLKKCFEPWCDILHIPIVYTKKQMEQACAELTKEQVEGVVIVFLSYSPSLITAPVLKQYENLPVLIWNTQPAATFNKNFSDTFSNHGMHGVQDLANVLLRENVRFSLITGHQKNSKTLSEIKKWCIAAHTAQCLKNATIGRIGGRFKDMGDFSIPDSSIRTLLGPEIIDISTEEISKQSAMIKNKEVEDLVRSDKKTFKIDKNLDNKTHNISCRLELSLRKLITQKKIDALGINFMSFRGGQGCEAIPFEAISKFMSEGLGYGGEGDVLCATSVFILQKLTGEGNFVEMFTTDYDNDRILMLHMGESNIGMAKSKKSIRLVKKPLDLIKTGLATSMFLFPLRPGKVTLFNIAPDNKGFRFILTNATIADELPFKNIDSPNFVLLTQGKVEKFLTQYSKIGGTHHLAMAYGNKKTELRFLAEIINIPVYEI